MPIWQTRLWRNTDNSHRKPMNGTVVPACVHHGDIVTGGVDLTAAPTANFGAERRIRFPMVPGPSHTARLGGTRMLPVSNYLGSWSRRMPCCVRRCAGR